MAFLFLPLAQDFLDSLLSPIVVRNQMQHQCIQEAKATVCPQWEIVQVISEVLFWKLCFKGDVCSED